MRTRALFLAIVIGLLATAPALAASIFCRQYGVLLRLGGIVILLAGVWLLLMWRVIVLELGAEDPTGDALVATFVGVPLLACGLMLLTGGLIGWGLARKRTRG